MIITVVHRERFPKPNGSFIAYGKSPSGDREKRLTVTLQIDPDANWTTQQKSICKKLTDQFNRKAGIDNRWGFKYLGQDYVYSDLWRAVPL